MKLFLGVILLISCPCFSIYLSQKYKKRKVFFSDFNNFNDKLKNEVNFSNNTIKRLSKNLNNSEFNNCLYNKIYDKDIDINIAFLTLDEQKFVTQYFNDVGTSDKLGQISMLESVSEYLKKKTLETQDEEKKYKTLYLKLGIMIGLLFFILLL